VSDETQEDDPRTWRWLGMTWNEADAKLAIITIGGTIIGGLILVVTIALALAAAHQQERSHTSGWTLALSASGWLVAAFLIRQFRRVKLRVWAVLVAVCLFGALFSLLALIGMAAGVK